MTIHYHNSFIVKGQWSQDQIVSGGTSHKDARGVFDGNYMREYNTTDRFTFVHEYNAGSGECSVWWLM
jgi:hypothetical protein